MGWSGIGTSNLSVTGRRTLPPEFQSQRSPNRVVIDLTSCRAACLEVRQGAGEEVPLLVSCLLLWCEGDQWGGMDWDRGGCLLKPRCVPVKSGLCTETPLNKVHSEPLGRRGRATLSRGIQPKRMSREKSATKVTKDNFVKNQYIDHPAGAAHLLLLEPQTSLFQRETSVCCDVHSTGAYFTFPLLSLTFLFSFPLRVSLWLKSY